MGGVLVLARIQIIVGVVGKGFSGFQEEGRGFCWKSTVALSSLFITLGSLMCIFARESPSLLYTFVINIIAVVFSLLFPVNRSYLNHDLQLLCLQFSILPLEQKGQASSVWFGRVSVGALN